jgi:hypothetical protein
MKAIETGFLLVRWTIHMVQWFIPRCSALPSPCSCFGTYWPSGTLKWQGNPAIVGSFVRIFNASFVNFVRLRDFVVNSGLSS